MAFTEVTKVFLSDLGAIGSLISGLAGGIAAFYAYKAIKTQTNSLTYAANVLAINEFIIKSYINRKPIKYGPNPKDADFVADREAARRAFIDDPDMWRSKCLANIPADETDSVLRHNQLVANEISHSLQHLGLAVFTGVLPLKLLLASNGDGIVLDWLVIKHMMDDHRRSGDVYSTQVMAEKIYAKRRHAEWIALVAFLWLRRNWHLAGQWNNALGRITENPYYGGVERIKKLVMRITVADKNLLSDQTRKEVRELTGLKI